MSAEREVERLDAKWQRLDFGRFGGLAEFDVGGVTLVLNHGEACIVDGILARVIADFAAMQQRAEAAEKDARRYRWLRDAAKVSFASGYRDAERSWQFPEYRTEACLNREIYGGLRWEIDAAIDAASTPPQAEGEGNG